MTSNSERDGENDRERAYPELSASTVEEVEQYRALAAMLDELGVGWKVVFHPNREELAAYHERRG